MSNEIDEFTRHYAFEVKGKMVRVRNLERNTSVELALGQTYTCEIGSGAAYRAFLTNIEFKNKLFFSVTVDLYSKDVLFKSDVYFYNPPVIFDRSSRFPLHVDTISNNVAFWSTLEHAADLPTHHSDVQFWRMALEKTASSDSKDCRLNIRETRKKSGDMFTKLDAMKNKKNLPTIRMENANNEAITIYGIQKNKPMEKLLQLHRGDRILTKFNTSYGEQELVVTVIEITRTSLVIEWDVKEGGLKRRHEIYVNNYKDPFWQNLIKLERNGVIKSRGSKMKEQKKDTSVIDFLRAASGKAEERSGGRKTLRRRRRPTPWWPRLQQQQP